MRPNAGIEIDATRAKYPTSKDGIKEAGLIPVAPEKKPPFVWIDGILTKDESFEYSPFQRCSKVPGMDFMCYKSSLFTALNEISKYFPNQFNVYPKTFMLPQEFLEFQREHTTICTRTQQPPTWVVKPRNSCCGNGIQIVQSVHEASLIDEQAVIQRYIKPFLVDGRKFDFRLYVLIASLDPLRLFIYKEGIARFCSEPFQMPTRANKADKFMHLTNTAINVENGQAKAEDFTKKASEIINNILKTHPEGKELWPRICKCARAVVISILPRLISLLPKQRDTRLIPLYIQKKSRKKKPSDGENDEEYSDEECSKKSEDEEQGSDAPMHLPPLKEKKKEKVSDGEKLSVHPVVKTKTVYGTDFSAKRRSLSQSPTHTININKLVPHAIPKPQQSKHLHEEAPVSEETVDKKKNEPKGLPKKQRYFHILGIDVILDSDLQPQILELNDRPSLSVTVDFEKELKTSFIRDAFYHVTTTGASRGENEKSGWKQIFPLNEDEPDAAIWQEIGYKATHPKPNGEIDAVPATVSRPPPIGLGSTQPHKKKKSKKKSKKAKE